jgi:uncharacterized protein (UPF0276 family)
MAGTSFKPEHLEAIFEDHDSRSWFEVHAENYMVAGGPRHRALERLRQDHAVSLHGVCLSLGGAQPLDTAHLARFRELVRRYQPALVSEHLAWSSHGSTFYNDLLPLPYTAATLEKVCSHVQQAQEALGVRILLENPATYVTFESSTLTETQFLRAIAQRTGCGLLLDLSNVVVSTTNHAQDMQQYFTDFPFEAVSEIHLAGHAQQTDDLGEPLLIDSHDGVVDEVVWRLYETVIQSHGVLPTLIEWDSQIPNWRALLNQRTTAQAILDRAPRVARDGRRHAA